MEKEITEIVFIILRVLLTIDVVVSVIGFSKEDKRGTMIGLTVLYFFIGAVTFYIRTCQVDYESALWGSIFLTITFIIAISRKIKLLLLKEDDDGNWTDI